MRAIGKLTDGTDKVFLDTTVEYMLGEGILQKLPEGVDKAVGIRSFVKDYF